MQPTSTSDAKTSVARLAAAAWPYVLLVVVGFLILLPKLGDYGFWDPWEPKYGESVREMFERDSYFVPYFLDRVRMAKPILVYWSIMAGAALFGLNEFGARIPGVGFAVGSLLAVYYAVSLLRGRQAGLLSALVLATMPQFFFIARQATPDVYLFTGLGLCLVYFCLGLYGPARRRNLHFGVSYACFALAVLAKGPIVAGVIVAGTLAVFGFVHIDWKGLRQPDRRPPMRPVVRQLMLFLVIFIVVAGPWHLAIVIEQGREFFTEFIYHHNVDRVAEKINQAGASDFYVEALIFGFFPWSCLIPVALALLGGLENRNLLRKRGLEVFLLIAAAVTLSAFSMSVTKFTHYLAPALIPIAVVVGLTVHRILEARNAAIPRLAWIAAFLLFVMPATDLARGRGEQLLNSFTVKSYVPETTALGYGYQALVMAVGVIMLLSIVARSRILVGAMIACAVLMAGYANATFIPAVSTHKTMKHLCETWRAQAPDQPIGFLGDPKYGVFFYATGRVERLNKTKFVEFMNPEKGALCVVQKSKMSELQEIFRERYPGHSLSVADDSHFRYQLIRSIPTGRASRPE